MREVSMEWLTLEAYAKVNLGLAVVARRADGYHDIDTIFQTVSLSDGLRLEGPREAVSLKIEGASLPTDERNLAFRAASILRERTGCPGLAIELEKRIPVAAGLGGGSSDAAAVLLGASALFRLDLDADVLGELALHLGSDVPFFLKGGTARGEGRGELLTPLRDLEGAWFVLATPPAPVTAAQGYAAARIGLTESSALIRLSCSAIQERDSGTLMASLRNDLEAGVVSYCPDVTSAREAMLKAGALAVLMSGSGPTVMGLVRTEKAARSIASRLEGRDLEIHVAEPTGVGSRITQRGRD